MHHGAPDPDAGGPPSPQDPSGEPLQDGQQPRRRLTPSVDRRGQLALQAACQPDDLVEVGAADDERAGAEDLVLEVGPEVPGVHGREGGPASGDRVRLPAAREDLHAGTPSELVDPFGVGAGQASGEHGGPGVGLDRRRRRVQEGVETGSPDREDEARVRAELPGPKGHRPGVFLRQPGGALRQRVRQQEDRVDAAHLRVDGDRPRPGRRRARDRQARLPRSGEPDRLDPRVGDERGAERRPVAVQHREDALGQLRLPDGLHDGPSGQLARAGVGVVRLDDHRAARRERGGGVAARHRERQREVARTEDRDGPERHPALPDLGRALARRVDARRRPAREIGALRRVRAVARGDAVCRRRAQVGCEQAQLPRRPRDLAGQPGGGEAGLGRGAPDEIGGLRVEPPGDPVEQRGAFFGTRRAVGVERLLREAAGPVHLGVAAVAVFRFETFPGTGIDGGDRPPRPGDALEPDQHLPGELRQRPRSSSVGRNA